MGTAVAERKGSAVARQASYTSALYGLNDGGGDFDGRPLLRLKDGEWLFGEADDVLDNEDVLAVNSRTIKQGWICFNDKNEPAETEAGLVADFLWPVDQALDEDAIYDEHPLPEVKGKRATPLAYRMQVSLELVVVKGPNKGTELIYKTTSTGGKRMVAKIAGEIGRRIDNGDENEVPLIALWSESYWNRTWKKDIWNPKHDLLDWVTVDTYEWDGDEDDDEPKKHPRPGEKTKAGDPVDSRRKGRKADADDDKPARGTRGRKAKQPDPEPEEDDEPEEAYDDDVEDDEDEAPPARQTRGRQARPARGTPARGVRGKPADDEPEDDEDEDEPAPRAKARRGAGRTAAADEPRARGRNGSERGSGRRKPDVDDTEEDADEAPRGRNARAGSRTAPRRGR
jgi:hypothetical protein